MTLHPFDYVGRCPCGALRRQRYDATVVVSDPASDAIVVAKQFTCDACRGTFLRQPVRRPDLAESDLLRVLDRRVQ